MYQKSKKEQSLVTYGFDGQAEDFQEVTEIIKITKRHFKKGEFYMQKLTLDELVLDKEYTRTELRTLFALKRRIDYNNRIKAFSQAEIAVEVKSSQGRVSDALKRLKTDGIIFKDGRELYFNDEFIKYAGDNIPKIKSGKLLTYAPKN